MNVAAKERKSGISLLCQPQMELAGRAKTPRGRLWSCSAENLSQELLSWLPQHHYVPIRDPTHPDKNLKSIFCTAHNVGLIEEFPQKNIYTFLLLFDFPFLPDSMGVGVWGTPRLKDLSVCTIPINSTTHYGKQHVAGLSVATFATWSTFNSTLSWDNFLRFQFTFRLWCLIVVVVEVVVRYSVLYPCFHFRSLSTLLRIGRTFALIVILAGLLSLLSSPWTFFLFASFSLNCVLKSGRFRCCDTHNLIVFVCLFVFPSDYATTVLSRCWPIRTHSSPAFQ